MTMTSNEKLDFQSDEMAFTIEPLNPNLDKAIKYVRANIEKIRSFKIRGVIVFDDLRVVQRALANLDENLMRKPDAGADVVNAIAPHAMLLSGEDPSISSAVTHITVEIMQKLLGEKELHNYWLESLKVDSNLQRSLNKAAGVYSLDVEADHPTTTSGGAEIQQALVASLLHRSYATISMGNTRLDKKLDNHKHKKRTKEIELHRNLLTNAKSKLLSFQKKPHLSEIIEPVTSKVNLFSHNQDLIIDPDGSFNLRECMDPLKEKVRLYRSGDKGKSVLFCDITVEQCLNLDPKLLGKILSSKDETIPGMGLEEKWYKVQDGYNIDKVAVKPTPYSISSRIFESKQLQTMRAIEGGNYVSHISFDYGKIFLKKNHVAENGASAKLEAWGIAQAIQHERKAGEKLFKGSTPKSEIFPNYDDIELPDIKTTKKLIGIIEKMRDENEDFNNLYDNEDAIKFLKSLGMQNVRIRFEDIMPEQSANLIGILNQLNAKYVFSKRKILTEFLNQNNNLTGIPSDEVQQEILNFLIPEITLQDIMAIGMSHADGGIVATNELQFLKSNELAHKAQPLIENKNGKLNVDSNKFITQLQLEKTLSSLGCNTYNIYKILSSDWRHGPAGAENLAKIFTPKLRKFMNVNLHISTLTTMIRKIGSMLVELSGFETANPDPNEKRTNAMSFLTLTDKDGVRIRVRFRENLNMGIVESMYIQNNSFYDNLLASEYQEQTQHLESDQENEISTILNQLKKDWDFFDKKYNERFKKDVYIPKNILIILKIYEQYINDFTKKDSNHLKALQIMILAGMRGKRLVQLNKMLNMKV